MKKNIILFLTFAVSITCFAGAEISFEETEYDLEKVELGSGTVGHKFVFKNIGDKPLLVKDVRSTCGCTYGAWTVSPVLPGDTGSVYVFYKNNVSGIFHKTVKVVSNSSNGKKKFPLTIKGETIKR